MEKQKKRMALDLEQEPFKLQLKSVRSELMALKANLTLKDNKLADITEQVRVINLLCYSPNRL